MDDVVRSILFGGVYPGTLIALALLAAFFLSPKNAESKRATPAWVLPAIAGLAALIVEYGLSTRITPWPTQSTERIHVIALLAGTLGVVEALTKRNILLRLPLRAAAFAFAGWALFEFRVRNGIVEAPAFWTQIAVLAGIMLLVSIALDVVFARARPMTAWLVLFTWAGILTPALLAAEYANGPYRMAMLMTPLLVALALWPILRRSAFTPAIIPLAIMVPFFLAMSATPWRAFSAPPWWTTAVLLAAPLVPAALTLFKPVRAKPWREAIILITATAIVVGVPAGYLAANYDWAALFGGDSGGYYDY